MKYCLKTENRYLETLTKHPLNGAISTRSNRVTKLNKIEN